MRGSSANRLSALARTARLLLSRTAGHHARRARRAGERLLMRLPALVGRIERGGVYFVVSTMPRRDDRGSQAVLACARVFADSGVPVHLLVLEFARDADHEVARLRQNALLPEAATVRYFWRHAAPSGDGGFLTETLRDVASTATAVHAQDRTTYFVDGVPVATVTQKQLGLEVEHLGHDGAPIRRDDYDEHHRLVRRLELRPDTGKVAMRRYLDADGTCWLSAWVVASSGRSGPVQVHSPRPVEFATYSDVRARWVSGELHRSVAALVVSDDSASSRVVARSRHPAAHRVVIGPEQPPFHSADLLSFYEQAITPPWRRDRSSLMWPPPPLRRP
jgi:hypothetical protein